MTILSDRPSASVSDDLLGLESRLSAVLDILRHTLTKCPITVAIYGDWGTGKTSAMHWLESQLETWNKLDRQKRESHPCVYPIWFDPWKYHTREDVWRGIISEVILSLFDAKNVNREDFIPRMKEAAKKFGAFLGKGFLHALANTELTLKADAGVLTATGGV
jgi:predicted KAP-like P-loop ATPase